MDKKILRHIAIVGLTIGIQLSTPAAKALNDMACSQLCPLIRAHQVDEAKKLLIGLCWEHFGTETDYTVPVGEMLTRFAIIPLPCESVCKSYEVKAICGK